MPYATQAEVAHVAVRALGPYRISLGERRTWEQSVGDAAVRDGATLELPALP